MKTAKFFNCIVLFLLCTSFLFSCSSYVSQKDYFYAGETVDPDKIHIIEDSLKNEEQTFIIKPTTMCYWTKSGSKFHLFPDCQSLSRTDPSNVETGIYNHIKDKKECCLYCMKNAISSES